MRILITNDDGIHAPGLAIAERVARTFTDDVFVVAPEYEQSGVAHSLSLNDPLRLREISPRHFALKGTPTDCVIMGVRKLMGDHPPDLLISGRQQRTERRRGCHLFRHHCRRHGRDDPWHSLHRPVAGL